MKKIPCLFVREDFKGNTPVTDKINPECQWVFDGEGKATRKFDGTCTLIKDGQMYARYTLKPKRNKPENFIPATEIDPKTGKQEGWVPTDPNNKQFQYHYEAFNDTLEDGTYELIGPKVQGNPEDMVYHELIPHGTEIIENVPRSYEGLKSFMKTFSHEGIVFWNVDGRMSKIRVKDFFPSRK